MELVAAMGADLPLAQVGAYARRVEAIGFDALSVPEARHEGTLACFAALQATSRLRVGAGVWVAFARSPMLAAQAAWDLHAFSGGRFELGLGTQVRGNVTGRFGMPWSAPAARMRDYVGAVRACFATFQSGAPLDFRSESYSLTRMQPFFNPGPLESEPPKILLGAVGPQMTRVAGELADVLQTHPTNSEPRYLREAMIPRLEEGRKRSSLPGPVEVFAGPLVATGPDAASVERKRAAARETLVFTLSTKAYWPVLEHHGWREVGEALRSYTQQGRWAEMNALVSDEIVDALVPAGRYGEIAGVLAERFAGVADRLLFPLPDDPANDAALAERMPELQRIPSRSER